MNITFGELKAVCKHNEAFEDIECNPICELKTPTLKNLGSCRYTGKSVLCSEDNCPFMNEVKEQEEEVYLILYNCHNCHTDFSKGVTKGKRAYGHGGTCPYCGAVDSTGHQGTSGLPWKHKVIGPYNPLNPRVYQW